VAKENGSSKGGNSGILRSILIILVVMLVFHAWFQTDPKGYEVVMSQIGFERQMD